MSVASACEEYMQAGVKVCVGTYVFCGLALVDFGVNCFTAASDTNTQKYAAAQALSMVPLAMTAF
jgi:hypothetical protein